MRHFGGRYLSVVSLIAAFSAPGQDEIPPPVPALAPVHGEFSISGNVVNSVTGEPVRRALIQVIGFPGIARSSVLADASGSFRIADLPPGKYRVLANKPGFTPRGPGSVGNEMISLGPSRDDFRVSLEPLAVIRGHVVDTYGEPLAGVMIQALASNVVDGRREITPSQSATTDDRGEYRFADMASGTYYIRASGRGGGVRMFVGQQQPVFDAHESFTPVYYDRSPDRASARAIILHPGQDAIADFALPMQPAYRINGTILDFVPRREMKLELLAANNELSAGRASVNVNTGRFQVADVIPGTYILRATQGEDENAATAIEHLQITTADLGRVRLQLLPGITITGTVIANRPPGQEDGRHPRLTVTACYVLLQQTDGESSYSGANTSFEMKNVQQGHYRITFNCYGGYVAAARSGDLDLLANPEITVGATAPAPIQITLNTDGGNIAVTVASEGHIVNQPEVLLIPASGNRPALRGTTSQGHFAFQAVLPGDYRVYAFDSLGDIEYNNPAALSAFGSGHSVHVDANGHTDVEVDIIATGAK